MLSASLSLVATAKDQHKAEKPYDLVLKETRITFDNTEELMQLKMPLLVRDLGVREVGHIDFRTGLSLVWDGKEYEFNMRTGITGTGPSKILPRTTWGTWVNLARYDVPKSALGAGKHTIAVRDKFAESNTLILFIENVDG